MKILKVVLTGGPCGGKTTTIEEIKKYLKKREIPFLIVPETATELIMSGIKPGEIPTYDFQSLVLKKQLSKEEITEEYAKKICQNKPICVIIYDRGILDNKAYLENIVDFQKLVTAEGLNEINLLDKYDLVLDLLSLATCKPESYNLLNEARTEDIAQAKDLDRKTTLSWIAHRNLKILSSKVPQEVELKEILKEIDEFISGIRTKHIRRFLVNNNSSNYNIYNENNSQDIYVTNYYLEGTNSNYQYVVSRRTLKNEDSYIFNVYKEQNGIRKIIEDKHITQEEYYNLINQNKIIKKECRKETCFIYNNQKYTLCFYDDLTILELETNADNKIYFPDNIDIITEINDYADKSVIHKKRIR